MFHILVARFLLEANENIPKKCDLNDVSLHLMYCGRLAKKTKEGTEPAGSWVMYLTARM